MSTTIECPDCQQPMTWLGTRTRWRGDYEFNDARYECRNACQVTATVQWRQFIPIEVARMRPDT